MGNNGTGFRFLMTLCGFYPSNVLLTGEERMLQRPVKSLADSLNEIGFKITYKGKEGFPPLNISTCKKILKNSVEINGEKSSQFISSLLLCSPLFKKDFSIRIKGKSVSTPYIFLTLDVMKSFGVNIVKKEKSFFIKRDSGYKKTEYIVENDFSSASYFAAASIITGKRVRLKNLFYEKSLQGDKKFFDVLKKMGANIQINEDNIIVCKGELNGINIDMQDIPDMVPTVALIAAFAKGETVIKNIAHLRYKETDRIECTVKNLRQSGVDAIAGKDYIKITHNPEQGFKKCAIDPENDHRMAMSFALLTLKNKEIEILNKNCVKKSFPDFWNEFKKIENPKD